MTHTRDFLQYYRDAEANGRIGVRAYLSYFQDIATEQLYLMGMGNDRLPEIYGMAWIYTKYRLHLEKEIGFAHPLHLEAWISRVNRARIWQEMEIRSGGELCCSGRVESCLLDLREQTMKPLSAIGFPEGQKEEQTSIVGAFRRPDQHAENMREVYTYIVRYSDLDKSHHMRNLQYLPMFLDAYSPEFYQENRICDMELHFLSQARFGDQIRIFTCRKEESVEFLAIKGFGQEVAWCRLELEEQESR